VSAIVYGHKPKEASRELIDYLMSEKFGLNWRKGESVRIQALMEILCAYNERDSKVTKKHARRS
jgi:ABC-type Fe3+ transport system substrate-binding protein